MNRSQEGKDQGGRESWTPAGASLEINYKNSKKKKKAREKERERSLAFLQNVKIHVLIFLGV